jgi:hypothetical protein
MRDGASKFSLRALSQILISLLHGNKQHPQDIGGAFLFMDINFSFGVLEFSGLLEYDDIEYVRLNYYGQEE